MRDVYADFNDLTLDIVATALFGSDMMSPTNATRTSLVASVAEAFEFFGKRSATGFIIPEWVPTPDNIKYNHAVAKLGK